MISFSAARYKRKTASARDAVFLLLRLLSYHKSENYVFESAVIAKDCHIQNERMDTVIENLSLLQIIQKRELSINGQKRILFYSQPSHKLLALFLIAHEISYKGAYTLQSHHRNTPFFKE